MVATRDITDDERAAIRHLITFACEEMNSGFYWCDLAEAELGKEEYDRRCEAFAEAVGHAEALIYLPPTAAETPPAPEKWVVDVWAETNWHQEELETFVVLATSEDDAIARAEDKQEYRWGYSARPYDEDDNDGQYELRD